MKGKVWLVGAGPGGEELLTVKGRRLLEEAEVVVYDRLIGPGILRYAPPEADMIDVGKSGGRHPVPQEEIQEILIAKALEGKRVVRLKGGDPFLFGRGGEEMEALTRRGIPWEPVPGVTSAVAVPAFAGIPVTHRDYASSLHIVTAHKREDAPIDYDVLARLKGTLVFLMGASEVREICRRLTEAGMDKNTPAAVVERGTMARQRLVTGVLDNLADRADRSEEGFSPVQSPAVVVVGRVVTLAQALDWRGSLPLSGRRVLTSNGRLAALLRARGAEVLEAFAPRTEAVDGPLPSLEGWGWLVFTSAAGAEFFFQALKRDRRDVREMGAAKIAAVGPKTKDALESRGLKVDLIPPVYSGAALAEALLRECRGCQGFSFPQRLLLLRAQDGAPDLPRVLKDGGLDFHEVPLYRTVPAALPKGIDLGDADAAAFTCASAVRSAAALYPHRIKAVCIGEQTAQAAREAGCEVTVAKRATLEDLADAVEDLLGAIQLCGSSEASEARRLTRSG